MPEPEITDKSILRCTIKKSASVLTKLVLYAACVIVGLIAATMAIYGLIGIYEVGAPRLTTIWQFLAAVPWYYYAGAGALAAIPAYSFLWCVARELTKEDWESDAAAVSALALSLALIAAIALAFAFALAFALSLALTIALTTAIALAFAFALAFALSLTFAIALAFATDNISSMWYYIVRFIGAAYHHYRNKKQEISGVTQ